MLQRLGTLASLLAFGLLCLWCVLHHGTAIPSAIRQASSTALSAASLPSVAIDVDGRDVTLRGEVPSEPNKNEAGRLAALVPGVRTVTNLLVVRPPVVTPPPVEQAREVQSKLDQILRRRIAFQTNSDVLLPAGVSVLDEALGVLRTAPELSVRVEGHTDSSGNAEANRRLSQLRAQAVVRWLGERGLDASRMTAEGFGPDRPVAPNDTPEGRAQNRRVDIIANPK